MWNSAYELYTDLQYKIHAQAKIIEAYRSEKKYRDLQKLLVLEHRRYCVMEARYKAELAAAHANEATVRKQYMEVVEDLEKEMEKLEKKLLRKLKKMEERALKAEREKAEMQDKQRDALRQKYEAEVKLEEEREKNKNLRAMLNHDYENSSKPSSQSPNHKKITNNREKTGRKPGGQPGHAHHPRKKRIPQNIVSIPTPEEFLDTAQYTPTGKTIAKQVHKILMSVITTEYRAEEYIENATGRIVHAKFPEGVLDEVNYDGTVKAAAYLLNNECNVSIDNVRRFFREITGGELCLSKGMINKLAKQFSVKSEKERTEILANIMTSPTMHLDFTSARVNGKGKNVLVCATEKGDVMYYARDHKGHEGIIGSAAEHYQGTMTHDHDKTFFNYGNAHQECLVHVSRYLKDSMDNEKVTWSEKMRGLITEMIHYRNSISGGNTPDSDIVADFEKRYDNILEIAREEYEYEPPGKYYRNGFNLYIRMRDYRDNHLLFLHDMRVKPDNNLSERLLRKFKRKQQQATTFRSMDNLSYLCEDLSVVNFLRSNSSNVFSDIAAIFGVLEPALP